MKTSVMMLALALTALVQAETAKDSAPGEKKLEPQEVREAIYRSTGGMVKMRGVQKGAVAYVNCQTRASAAWLEEHAALFAGEFKIDLKVVPGAFAFPPAELPAEAAIFVVDDPKLPMSLVAPEAKWALVNVAPLATEKEAFFKARVQKELARAFALLLGAASSQFPQALTEPVTSPAELDRYAAVRLPYDLVRRVSGYLPGIGVVPYKLVPYRRACKEGWAESPTNDVQRKIWDAVHEKPTQPRKIKFDPKKGE